MQEAHYQRKCQRLQNLADITSLEVFSSNLKYHIEDICSLLSPHFSEFLQGQKYMKLLNDNPAESTWWVDSAEL